MYVWVVYRFFSEDWKYIIEFPRLTKSILIFMVPFGANSFNKLQEQIQVTKISNPEINWIKHPKVRNNEQLDKPIAVMCDLQGIYQ